MFSQTRYLSKLAEVRHIDGRISKLLSKVLIYSFIDKIEFKLRNSKKFLRLNFIKSHL
ncbi:hypothetical protein MBORA_11050 [Methanobrevibacter oralis]|uniref:Uncharacterized protein n=1 Tax=Methanobrevibacter oralis TaxID=66851 RepID=A0A166AY52_METOA|nr:hypothetical protein MBORA_11050 [Methanobrevibacter oralis]